MTHPLWHIDAVSGGGVHPIETGSSDALRLEAVGLLSGQEIERKAIGRLLPVVPVRHLQAAISSGRKIRINRSRREANSASRPLLNRASVPASMLKPQVSTLSEKRLQEER
jgi:hypothetical protein